MARISRKDVQLERKPAPTVLYKAAGYIRLSVEDKDDGDSGSLENQKSMIENFAEKSPDIKLYSMHTDNGQTGTNFDRPGFEALMDEVRHGKINCIIVKDLSRFGRDYVEAGSLLEIILPQLGVRFISLNDNFDSFDPRCQGDGVIVALKNMINSFYSKDISAKMRAAYEIKQKKGEFTGSFPPYGYLKSGDSKGKLAIDPEAGETVRQIFKLKLDGLSVHQISSWLNERNIPTPGHYRYIKKIFQDKRYKNPQVWNDSSVIKILKAATYLGHLTLGKTRANPDKVYDYIPQPKEKWLITENAHEALVTQADFDKVSELLEQTHERIRQRVCKKWDNPENIFKGFAFCADCGHVFGRKRISSAAGHTSYAYICATCKNGSPDKADRHYFKQDAFQNKIFQAIRKQIEICANTRLVIEKMRSNDPNKQKREELENEIRQAQKRLDRLPGLKEKLYDDYVSGVIDKSDCLLFGSKYDEESAALTERIGRFKSEIAEYLPEFTEKNKRLNVMELFKDEKSLTREMLLALVERIEIKSDFLFDIKYRFQDEYAKILPYVPTEESEGNANV